MTPSSCDVDGGSLVLGDMGLSELNQKVGPGTGEWSLITDNGTCALQHATGSGPGLTLYSTDGGSPFSARLGAVDLFALGCSYSAYQVKWSQADGYQVQFGPPAGQCVPGNCKCPTCLRW